MGPRVGDAVGAPHDVGPPAGLDTGARVQQLRAVRRADGHARASRGPRVAARVLGVHRKVPRALRRGPCAPGRRPLRREGRGGRERALREDQALRRVGRPGQPGVDPRTAHAQPQDAAPEAHAAAAGRHLDHRAARAARDRDDRAAASLPERGAARALLSRHVALAPVERARAAQAAGGGVGRAAARASAGPHLLRAHGHHRDGGAQAVGAGGGRPEGGHGGGAQLHALRLSQAVQGGKGVAPGRRRRGVQQLLWRDAARRLVLRGRRAQDPRPREQGGLWRHQGDARGGQPAARRAAEGDRAPRHGRARAQGFPSLVEPRRGHGEP